MALDTSISLAAADENHDTVDVVVKEEKAFLDAMIEYEKTAKEKYKTGINIADTHTLSQVWQAIDDALNKYDAESTKGLWGKVRSAFKTLGAHKDTAEGWLGLLPNQSAYMSVVCGGLKLIITAIARMKKVADEVMEALHEIPTILNGAQRVLGVYQGSKALEKASSELYCAVIRALGHMLGYLRQSNSAFSKTMKVVSAAFKGAGFQSTLTDKINTIAKVRDSFNQEADICQKEMLKANSDGVVEIKNGINSVKRCSEISSMEQKRTAEIMQRVQGLEQGLKSILEFLKSEPKLLDHSYTNRSRLDIPEGGRDRRQLQRPPSVSIVGARENDRPPQKALRDRLLYQLDYDPDIVAKDLLSNYTLAARLSNENQERSLYVIRSDTFAKWLTADESSVLAIHGGAPQVSRQSAMSFVCARMAHALDQLKTSGDATHSRLVSLFFFCGEHATQDSSREMPSGVINSLLAQLLTQSKRGVDLTKADSLENIDSYSVNQVFKRFKTVLAELPSSKVVICVVDGLSFYLDSTNTRRDAELLIRRLLKLSHSQPSKMCKFKLLLTAPKRFHSAIVESLEPKQVLTVPPNLPNTGGFTAMKWDVTLDQQLSNFIV